MHVPKGFEIFFTEKGDCFHCHGGAGNPLFTTHLFYNNGKDTVFMDPFDRYSMTGDPMDQGAYKAPTLRNIEFTAPYMHDGRFNTLDEVIDSIETSYTLTGVTDEMNDKLDGLIRQRNMLCSALLHQSAEHGSQHHLDGS